MYVMGRRVPIENLSLIHPVIYLSFLAAGLAASMAIITALCSVRFGRKTSTPPTTDPIDLDGTLASNTETENENNNNDNEVQVKELPLPPAMQQPKDSFISERMKRVTSERKAPLSLSIKMPRSLSLARNWDQMKEDKHKGNIEGKLKAEDSVWMKTIILGEKCVPNEEDDPVIYEGRGKRIAAYHTKRQSTICISRQCSSIDPDALPSSEPQSQTQDETTTSNT